MLLSHCASLPLVIRAVERPQRIEVSSALADNLRFFPALISSHLRPSSSLESLTRIYSPFSFFPFMIRSIFP